jgi:uncharacterized protein (TIGR04222 family)
MLAVPSWQLVLLFLMTLKPVLTSASIPILDWRGPEFLIFYIFALTGALLWSLHLQKKAAKRFESTAPPSPLTDPFEIAFLAGGVPRVCQLAVARLLKLDLAKWERHWRGDRLISGSHQTPPPDFHPVEAVLHNALLAKPKGIALKDLPALYSSACAPLESRLARLGLRPTASEMNLAAQRSVLPLIAVLCLGILKLIIGLSRDKPVFILILLLIATLIVSMIFQRSATSKRLTLSGTNLLARLRTEQATQSRASGFNPDFSLWSTGVALAGTYAMTGLADQALVAASLDQHLARRPAPANGDGGSSGCGSSGGGSSGCGSSCGGGCGGCGGGGD